MITVSKGVLKAKMLEYFRRIERTGEEIVVTDNRIPVLRINPIKTEKKSVDEVFKDLRGKVKYHGNIMKPETKEWGDV